MTIQKKWKSTSVDVIFAIVIGLGLGQILALLNASTGALVPLVIYYSLCIIMPLWRRNDSCMLHYDSPLHLIGHVLPKQYKYRDCSCSKTVTLHAAQSNFLFWILLTDTVATMVIYSFIIQPVNDQYYLYSLIWSFINAFCEQLLWFYVLDSFTNRFCDYNHHSGDSTSEDKIDSIHLAHVTSSSENISSVGDTIYNKITVS